MAGSLWYERANIPVVVTYATTSHRVPDRDRHRDGDDTATAITEADADALRGDGDADANPDAGDD